ncbi:hypothetical protein EMMF5_005844 [Cystobasidiomycetes sp. EMM_F5]
MYTSIKTFGLTAVLAVSAAALVAGHEQQDRSAAGKRHQNMRRGGLSEAEGMHNLEKRDYTYGDYGQQSYWCGKKLVVTGNGKTATVTVADACPGCGGDAGLDMTPSLFAYFTDPNNGVMQISWHEEGAAQAYVAPTTKEEWKAPTTTWTPDPTTWTPAWTPSWTPSTAWTPSTTWEAPKSTWTPWTSTAQWTPSSTSVKWTPSSSPVVVSSSSRSSSLSVASGIGAAANNGSRAVFTGVAVNASTSAGVNSTRTGVLMTVTALGSPIATGVVASAPQGNLGRAAQIVIDVANLVINANN